MKSCSLSSVLYPGIDSSLSIVPPVCPSPLPDILASFAPHAATIGAMIRVVLSPTPPVECLSTVASPNMDRSTLSPESAIAYVSAAVSASVMELKHIAIASAAI